MQNKKALTIDIPEYNPPSKNIHASQQNQEHSKTFLVKAPIPVV